MRVVHQPAEQRPDRAVAGLAEDVPAGDLEPREGAHDGQVGALGEARGIGAAEHQLDVFGVLAGHVAGEDVRDHRPHRLGADRGGIAFAPAGDAVVGGELDEDPVAPAPARGRRGGDDDVEIGEFHGALLFDGGSGTRAVCPRPPPATPRSLSDKMKRGRSEDDHVALGAARLGVGDGLVDLLERASGRRPVRRA